MINVNVKFVVNCGSFGYVVREGFCGNWKELRQFIREGLARNGADFVVCERVEAEPVHNVSDLAGMLERAWHESEGPGNRKERCIRNFCQMSGWERKAAPIKDLCRQLSAEAAVDGRGYFVSLLKEVM